MKFWTMLPAYPGAKEFIAVVLLTSFLWIPGWETTYDVDLLDFFSGRARISRACRYMGYKAFAFDITYHPVPRGERKRGKLRRSCMDMNGAAGFVFLLVMLDWGPKVGYCWNSFFAPCLEPTL